MPEWVWIVDGLGAALLLIVLAAVGLVLRRRWLARSGGTFELSHRRDVAARRGWMLGIGRYADDRLEFFRVFSLAPRPRHVLHRGDLVYEGSRDPHGPEMRDLYAAHVVVRCRTSAGDVELAMAPEAVTGFLAWLEAAPPGRPARRS